MLISAYKNTQMEVHTPFTEILKDPITDQVAIFEDKIEDLGLLKFKRNEKGMHFQTIMAISTILNVGQFIKEQKELFEANLCSINQWQLQNKQICQGKLINQETHVQNKNTQIQEKNGIISNKKIEQTYKESILKVLQQLSQVRDQKWTKYVQYLNWGFLTSQNQFRKLINHQTVLMLKQKQQYTKQVEQFKQKINQHKLEKQNNTNQNQNKQILNRQNLSLETENKYQIRQQIQSYTSLQIIGQRRQEYEELQEKQEEKDEVNILNIAQKHNQTSLTQISILLQQGELIEKIRQFKSEKSLCSATLKFNKIPKSRYKKRLQIKPHPKVEDKSQNKSIENLDKLQAEQIRESISKSKQSKQELPIQQNEKQIIWRSKLGAKAVAQKRYKGKSKSHSLLDIQNTNNPIRAHLSIPKSKRPLRQKGKPLQVVNNNTLQPNKENL